MELKEIFEKLESIGCVLIRENEYIEYKLEHSKFTLLITYGDNYFHLEILQQGIETITFSINIEDTINFILFLKNNI